MQKVIGSAQGKDINVTSELNELYSFAIPLIRFSTDTKIPNNVYLCEDGLTLWEESINQCQQMTQDFLSIFPHISSLMKMNLDNTRVVMNVIDQYLVLGSQNFLQVFNQ